MSGALEGLTVLEVANHLSGPFCGMMLADHGADVIKIERKGVGDEARCMPPFVNGEGAPFMVWNRNKRSLELDLKAEADKAKFLSLIDKADVLLENFRPGTMDRLGLGYKDLSARNPRLIYASISGFGQTGPYKNLGGFDLVVQGMSGLMSVNGPVDGPPYRLPIAISDVTAGMNMAFGILAAVEARHRTGKGQLVETSLLETATSLCVYEAAHYFSTGERPPRIGQAHRGGSPYQVFEASDGYVTVGAATQVFWEKFCAIIQMPELLQDPRFTTAATRVTHNNVLVEIIQAKLITKPAQYWIDRMEADGIPAGKVMAIDEILTDNHMLERGMVAHTVHPKAGDFDTLGIPIKLSDTPGEVRKAAPLLGENNSEFSET